MVLLEAKALGCTYPNGIQAVKGLDLSLSEGELVGLIGPDGAGKTTAFRMFMGLKRPTSGSLDLHAPPEKIGYVPQTFSLAPDLTVEENLRLQAGLYGLKNFDSRLKHLLETVELEPFRARRARALSGGMKQKLSLCVALLPEPRLLLLDEPTTGVDPVSRREFWDLLHEVHEQGVGILFSSPYMDEAEYAHRMLLLHEGRVLDEGTLESFQAKLPGVVLKVTTARRRAVQQALAALSPLDLFGEGEIIRARFPEQAPGPLMGRISGLEGVERVELSESTLEDFFLHSLTEAEAEHD